MSNKIKKSLFSKLRNYFFAGMVVLIPIVITIYLTLIIIRLSSRVLPKEINPNHYLPVDIPGIGNFNNYNFSYSYWLDFSFIFGKKTIRSNKQFIKKDTNSKNYLLSYWTNDRNIY